MTGALAFSCVGGRADPYAAGPTLVLRIRVAAAEGERVHAAVLRVQIRIEPQRRRYEPAEAARLEDVLGEPSRWADTLRPLQFATVPVLVPAFEGAVEVDVPVPCTYDLDIAGTSYLHGLAGGEIPLLLLFSGTVFWRPERLDGADGFSVAQVPWSCEARYRLPVSVWRLMMDHFFPGGGWLRLHRDTLDALGAYKTRHALPTWEQAVVELLKQADAAGERS